MEIITTLAGYSPTVLLCLVLVLLAATGYKYVSLLGEKIPLEAKVVQLAKDVSKLRGDFDKHTKEAAKTLPQFYLLKDRIGKVADDIKYIREKLDDATNANN